MLHRTRKSPSRPVGVRWRRFREGLHRLDDAPGCTLWILDDYLAIPWARQEPRLDDDPDGHGVERVFVATEVERVIVLHAAGYGLDAWQPRLLTVAFPEQLHEARRPAGGVPPGPGDFVP